MNVEQSHQDALPGMPRARRRSPAPITTDRPVARVLIDSPLPHLDREFDYLVPERLDAHAQVGARVSVMFAGSMLSGYVLERVQTSEHTGKLAPLRRANSPVPVLTRQITTLIDELASYYAGTRSDLLRLAIPPRHATTERRVWPQELAAADQRACAPAKLPTPQPEQDVPWPATPSSLAFLRRLRAGQGPRAAWCAPPWDSAARPAWPQAFAQAAAATRASGRGAILVVPHNRALDQLQHALSEAGIEDVARLAADDGPARRYREYLRVLGGSATIVIGTRHAAFAPVHNLGLIACWDEASDLHSEPRAPYPHTRTVASIRSRLSGCALLLAGYARSVETQQLVARNWLRDLPCERTELRRLTPRVHALAEIDLAAEGPLASVQIPPRAWRLAREAVRQGPVLIQVPRAGYAPALVCGQCRTPSRCSFCHGPLTASTASVPACRWCGRLAGDHVCEHCGAPTLRPIASGAERTAEDLGRAFPNTPIRRLGANLGEQAEIRAEPAIVIATPGAEIAAGGGYRAGLLLDAAAMLSRPDLDASIEALRRWLNAAALVAPAPEGTVILTGAGDSPPAQALVRWDPAGYAARELAERTELGLPPARPAVSLTGEREAVERVVRRLGDLPECILGPVDVADGAVRTIVQVPSQRRATLAQALRAAQATRSAHKEAGTLRVQVDPPMQI